MNYPTKKGRLISPLYLCYGNSFVYAADQLLFHFHTLRHPYVKHTTKNIILKSRKPKLPILVLIVWVFCFCFLFYDFARSIGGIISIISFKDYFCCSTAFFTAEI